MSASHSACFSYGHAVGHAAAMAVRDRLAVRQIDAGAVHEAMPREGAVLNFAALEFLDERRGHDRKARKL